MELLLILYDKLPKKRRGGHTEAQREVRENSGGRQPSTSQANPSGGTGPADPSLKPPASGIGTKYMSAVYTTQSAVVCYGNPNKLTQSLRTHLSVPSSAAEMAPELNNIEVQQY